MIKFKSILLLLAFTWLSFLCPGQVNIRWQLCFGGIYSDKYPVFIQTSDGGFLMGGSDYDIVEDDYNAMLVKIDSSGNLLWTYENGIQGFDEDVECILETPDSLYLIAINDEHDILIYNSGNINPFNGLYGGSNTERVYSLIGTQDGGYAFAGTSYSNDGDVTGHHGSTSKRDGWVVKLDSVGNIEWQISLGGSLNDHLNSIIQLPGGEYIVAGYVESHDGDVSFHHDTIANRPDCWIVKLSASGTMIWEKTFGGTLQDEANCIINSPDGNLLFIGTTGSNDGDVTGIHGGNKDIWVVKIDTAGNLLWQKCYGSNNTDYGKKIINNLNGGYTIFGEVWGASGDVSQNFGFNDFWLAEIDTAGNLISEFSLGGSSSEKAYDFMQTGTGDYVMLGGSNSNDGHVSGNIGGYDGWIVKACMYPDASIMPLGSTTFCYGDSVQLVNSNPGATYQWYRNGNAINGAVAVNYYAKTTGLYQCLSSGPTTCTAFSNEIQVNVPCRRRENNQDKLVGDFEPVVFEYYPNPARHTLSVNSSGGLLVLTNSFGQALSVYELQNGMSEIDISILPAGLYILRFVSYDSTMIHKLVVK